MYRTSYSTPCRLVLFSSRIRKKTYIVLDVVARQCSQRIQPPRRRCDRARGVVGTVVVHDQEERVLHARVVLQVCLFTSSSFVDLGFHPWTAPSVNTTSLPPLQNKTPCCDVHAAPNTFWASSVVVASTSAVLLIRTDLVRPRKGTSNRTCSSSPLISCYRRARY